MLPELKPPKTLKDYSAKALIILGISIVLIAIFCIINYLVSYWLITFFIMMFLLYCLIYSAGTILMFPGYFNYYKGSVENNYSKDLRRKLQNAFNNLEKIHSYLITGVNIYDGQSFILSEQILNHYKNILQKFKNENTLSTNKTLLLEKIKELLETYCYQESNKDSIRAFMNRRHNLNCARKPSSLTSLRLSQLALEAKQKLNVYKDPESNFFQNFLHQSYMQKLYEIRFGIVLYEQHFHYEQHLLDKKINLVIIKGYKEDKQLQSSKLVMFCNPNGAFLQSFPFQTSYVRFYLEKGYNVVLWNYRGYSKSIGSPSLSNNKQDALLVYDFVKSKRYSIEIIHGYSIGGPTAIYLASKRNTQLLIADRTFSSLVELVKNYGHFLIFFMKIVFYKQRTNYSELYLSLDCNKLIIYDPYDEVINNVSSLKTGVSRLVMSMIGYEQHDNITFYSEEPSGLFLNAKSALKKILPSKMQQKQSFPSQSFVKSLLWNSLPFVIDTNIKSSKRLLSSRRHDERSLQTIMESLHNDISKQQLEISCQNIKNAKMIDQQVIEVIGNIKYVDSALMYIPTLYLNRFKRIVQDSDPSEEMRSYIEGLIVFGSYPLVKQHYEGSRQIRTETIIKLYYLCEQLKGMYEDSKQLFQREANLLHNLRIQFTKIAIMIYSNINNNAFEKAGMILPVDCGHNGQMRPFQYRILSQIIMLQNNTKTFDFEFVSDNTQSFQGA